MGWCTTPQERSRPKAANLRQPMFGELRLPFLREDVVASAGVQALGAALALPEGGEVDARAGVAAAWVCLGGVFMVVVGFYIFKIIVFMIIVDYCWGVFMSYIFACCGLVVEIHLTAKT